jgi:hypothetical protein
MNAQRQLKASLIQPARAGPTMPGSTQALLITAIIRGCTAGG